MKSRFLSACMAIAALLIIAVPLGANDPAPNHRHTRFVVFGDSLSDPGNYFAAFHAVSQRPFAALPDAPYAMGGLHYSNGETWIEQLGHDLHRRQQHGAGAAKSRQCHQLCGRLGAGTLGSGGVSALRPVDSGRMFLGQTGGQAPESALYVLWIGGQRPEGRPRKPRRRSDASRPPPASSRRPSARPPAISRPCGTPVRAASCWSTCRTSRSPRTSSVSAPSRNMLRNTSLGEYNAGLGQAVAALSVLPGSTSSARRQCRSATAALDLSVTGIRDFDTPCLRFAVVEDAVCRPSGTVSVLGRDSSDQGRP